MDALEGVERFVEEEGGVVDEHVDEADELLPAARLTTNGLSMRRHVPQRLHHDGDVVPEPGEREGK